MCLDFGFSEWTSYHKTLNVTIGIWENGRTQMELSGDRPHNIR